MVDEDEEEETKRARAALEESREFWQQQDRKLNELDDDLERLLEKEHEEAALRQTRTEAFEDRCRLCIHKSWDAFESGVPIYPTCKHPSNQYGGSYGEYVDCARLAERYEDSECPYFFPVILRMPFRLAWRGFLRMMRRRYG